MQLIMEPEFKPRQPDSRVPMLMFLRSSIPARREATQTILEICRKKLGQLNYFQLTVLTQLGIHMQKKKRSTSEAHQYIQNGKLV